MMEVRKGEEADELGAVEGGKRGGSCCANL